MTIPEKYEFISKWFYKSGTWEHAFRPFNTKTAPDLLQKIEGLIDDKLPDDYVALYSQFNGEVDVLGSGTLRGHAFLPLNLVIGEMELCQKKRDFFLFSVRDKYHSNHFHSLANCRC